MPDLESEVDEREERGARSRARQAESGKKIGVALAEEFKRIELWR